MMRPGLTMTLSTQRNQGDGSDPFGGGADWQDHLTDEACYWWVAGGDEAVSETRTVEVADEHVFVAHGADIRQGDRAVKVVDHKGRVVFDVAAGGVFRQVEHVADDRDFFDATLRRAG